MVAVGNNGSGRKIIVAVENNGAKAARRGQRILKNSRILFLCRIAEFFFEEICCILEIYII